MKLFKPENYTNDGCDKSYPLKLYHISEQIDLDVLYPKIPFASGINEDRTIPRVCLSPSINGCLSAIAVVLSEISNFAYVYEVDTDLKNLDLRTPNIYEVFDAKDTQEVWSLEPVPLRRVGIIRILEGISEKQSLFYVQKRNYIQKYNLLKWAWDIFDASTDVDMEYLKRAYNYSKYWCMHETQDSWIMED